MKDYTYCLYFLDAAGEMTPILEDTKSARRVANVAAKIKPRPGRRVLITRDGKRLPGGASALDLDLLQQWLEENHDLE